MKKILIALSVVLSVFTLFIYIGLSAPQYITRGNVGQPLYTLTITGSGTGIGTVTSSLYGISCTSTAGTESGACSVQIPMGTSITLTATPASGNMFNGWTGGGCSGTGTCTINVQGNTTVDGNFLNIPSASLWAWFKTNEGSGTNIIDYSPTALNGSLVAWNGAATNATQRNFFWNTNPGFGTQNANIVNFAKVSRTSAGRNTRYISSVAFAKPLGQNCTPGGFNNWCIQAGESSANPYVAMGWRNAGAPTAWWNLGTIFSTTHAPVFGTTWYCLFGYMERSGPSKMYVRSSGGAFIEVLSFAVGFAGVGNQTLIHTHNTNSANSVVIGDILVWADSVSTGIISLSQANSVYESLKSRYGML